MSLITRLKFKLRSPSTTSESTRLRNSLVRREKLLARVRSLLPHLQTGLIVIGFLYLFALPTQRLGRRHYISENALQPGQVNTYWNWADVHIADEYAKDVEKWSGWEVEARATAIQEAFFALGLPAATQEYVFELESSSSTLRGTNVYSILQAPKTDGAEALVLSASWLSRALDAEGKRRVNIRGVATVLALANFLKKYSTWSKDIILLISDDYVAGAQAWVDEYHGSHQSNLHSSPLPLTTGPIWAALNLDYPYHSFSHLGLFYEGVNGHLANLDFVNSASHIIKQMGVTPILHADIKLADLTPSIFFDTPLSILDNHAVRTYMRAAKVLVHQLALGASGKPEGPESVFGKYRIDALSFFGVPAEGPHGFHALGRIVESTFRSLNNLLERFHQSFFLYIMTSVETFITVGNYLAAPVLVCAGMTIMGLTLWEQAGASTTGVTRERRIGRPLAIMGLTHAIGFALFSYVSGLDPTQDISSRLPPSITFLLLFTPLLLSSLFASRRRKGRAPTSLILKSFMLMIGGMTIGVVATLNFGAAVLLSLSLCLPLTIVTPRKNGIVSRLQQFGIVAFSPPATWALVRVFWMNAADEWAKEMLMDWHLTGSWSMPFGFCVIVPLLLQAAAVGLLE